MYDYSLVETITNSIYHVKIFYLNEDAKELENLMMNKNVKIIKKEDHFCEKTERVLSHVEWVTFDIQKESPFYNEELRNDTATRPG